jgi:hypothetical protein
MAKPPDHARAVAHPVGGVTYQLQLGGAPWMRIGQDVAGRVVLDGPMTSYDSATVVSLVVEAGTLRTTIRLVDERAASTPGTDLVDVIDLVRRADAETTRSQTLAVPPGGPTWATLERTGARHRVVDPRGVFRAELDATADDLVVRAFDEHGQPIAPQPYLMV